MLAVKERESQKIVQRSDTIVVTVRDAIVVGSNMLRDAGIEMPNLDARILLNAAAQMDAEAMVRSPEAPLAPKVFHAYLQMLMRRKSREPVAYITGNKSFWSLDFEVTCDTLIPRPDSETLIETTLACIESRSKPYTIVDVGVGSGCLLLSLLSELPRSNGIGLDISAEALQVASKNAARLGMGHRTRFMQSNWMDGLTDTVDVIISNPPYIPSGDIAGLQPDVRLYEPVLALDGGTDGMNPYRIIAKSASKRLSENGLLVVEFGIGQADAIHKILQSEGLRIERVEKDLAGITRCIAARRL